MAQVWLAGDDLVSRRHATVTVGETVEVVDLNSANGVEVDGRLVARVFVDPDTTVRVGDTTLRIRPLPTAPSVQGAGAPASTATEVDFSRSPRVEPAHRGRQFTLPEIPVPGEKPRLPMIAIIAPIILGAVLFLVTKQPYTLIFIALSPVIMIGTWIDQRVQARRRRRDERQRFEESLADSRERLAAPVRGDRGTDGRVTRPGGRDGGDARPLGAALDPEARAHHLPRGPLRGRHATVALHRHPAVEELGQRRRLEPRRGARRRVRHGRAGARGRDVRTRRRDRCRRQRVAADEVARSLVVQLAGLHSPGGPRAHRVRRGYDHRPVVVAQVAAARRLALQSAAVHGTRARLRRRLDAAGRARGPRGDPPCSRLGPRRTGPVAHRRVPRPRRGPRRVGGPSPRDPGRRRARHGRGARRPCPARRPGRGGTRPRRARPLARTHAAGAARGLPHAHRARPGERHRHGRLRPVRTVGGARRARPRGQHRGGDGRPRDRADPGLRRAGPRRDRPAAQRGVRRPVRGRRRR